MDLGRDREARTLGPGWLSDFTWRDGRLEIRKTGVRLPLSRPVIGEILTWLPYLLMLAVAAPFARLTSRTRLSLWFTPDTPRPWYMIQGAALWGGIATARSPQEADAAFCFDDSTTCRAEAPAGLPGFNFGCTDVSKRHVARIFEEVFGYPLALDPRRAEGPIVEKSDRNGVHDGRIVNAPALPRDGFVYQRLVDTEDGGFNHDLRTVCVDGRPLFVVHKHKAAGESFAIHTRRAVIEEPERLFSAAELERIAAFNARMGLDWGGLDILRDRHDGRLYIVDANKTDLGPVIALGWADKARSMRRLGRALERMILARRQAVARPERDAA
ncbi:MAG: hypothetical protein K1X35_02445 [Caulobacteraceae bacterium]|nr:hypothetical protein [Caulobacteraceae bacterium]